LSEISGLAARGDRAWIAVATSSLPQPVSPVISTGSPTGASRSISAYSRATAGSATITRCAPMLSVCSARSSPAILPGRAAVAASRARAISASPS